MPYIDGTLALVDTSLPIEITPNSGYALNVFNQSACIGNLKVLNLCLVLTNQIPNVEVRGDSTLFTIATLSSSAHFPSNTVTAQATVSFYDSGFYDTNKDGVYYSTVPVVIDTSGNINLVRRVENTYFRTRDTGYLGEWLVTGAVVSLTVNYINNYYVSVDSCAVAYYSYLYDTSQFPINLRNGSHPSGTHAGHAGAHGSGTMMLTQEQLSTKAQARKANVLNSPAIQQVKAKSAQKLLNLIQNNPDLVATLQNIVNPTTTTTTTVAPETTTTTTTTVVPETTTTTTTTVVPETTTTTTVAPNA